MQTLVDEGIRVKDLVTANNMGLDKANRTKLTELKKEEKLLLRAHKREPQNRNNYFFGDATAAKNASDDDLKHYEEILEKLKDLYKTKKINSSTYEVCQRLISDLQFAHTYNKQISLELSIDYNSETYGASRLSLHAGGRDAPFELKAGYMLSRLLSAYNFSVENNILADFFTDGLGKTSGCLEARIGKLETWQKKISGYLTQSNIMPFNSQKSRFKLPAGEAVLKIIENKFEKIDLAVGKDLENINDVAQNLANTYYDSIGCDGEALSYQLFRSKLKEVFLVTSPVSVSTFDFDTDDIIMANHESYLDIAQVQMASGDKKKCSVRKTKSDGNCGFSALGTTRKKFIHLVLSTYNNRAMPNDVKNLIKQAMQEAGVNSVKEWAEAFSSPGYWMNDTHLALYALLYDITIHVYALDHATNTFVLVQTFNPGQAQEAHIVNINLNPIMDGQAGPHMTLNHFDALEIEDENTFNLGVIPLLAPLLIFSKQNARH